jgi:hypothetical protein
LHHGWIDNAGAAMFQLLWGGYHGDIKIEE